MKHATSDILLSIFILFIFNSGCVNDDMAECLTDNVKLDFNLYAYPNDSTRFARHIHSVDVFIFDSDSLFVTRKRVTRKDMARIGFLGTNISLLPGKYLIACWANADSSTHISPMSKCQTLLGQTSVSMSAVPGDSLYYAPAKIHDNSGYALLDPGSQIRPDTLYKVDINYGGRQEKEIDFIRAYRSINVYIIGYTDTKGGKQPPLVELSDISTLYDFKYHTISSEKKSFSKPTQTTTYGTQDSTWSLWAARFFTIYEPITDYIQIKIKDSETNLQLGFVTLKKYLDEHPDVDPDDIDILFEFSGNTLISITNPQWGENQVIPGY
ncbi:MAG: FimB/Mfa2 family fimbrial subunit [Tannerellaceae bacterium]|jgi:hypothetical protein|nr:FimB/Mfa2 family fimbrial subunit [Tannerellaceae bacterium]